LLDLDGQVHPDTHPIPMGNYVIGVRNYMIATPSQVGNYLIADRSTTPDSGQVGQDMSDRQEELGRTRGHLAPGMAPKVCSRCSNYLFELEPRYGIEP